MEEVSKHVLKAFRVYHRFISESIPGVPQIHFVYKKVSLAMISKQESANVKSHLGSNSQLSIYYAVVISDSLISTTYNNNDLISYSC